MIQIESEDVITSEIRSNVTKLKLLVGQTRYAQGNRDQYHTLIDRLLIKYPKVFLYPCDVGRTSQFECYDSFSAELWWDNRVIISMESNKLVIKMIMIMVSNQYRFEQFNYIVESVNELANYVSSEFLGIREVPRAIFQHIYEVEND